MPMAACASSIEQLWGSEWQPVSYAYAAQRSQDCNVVVIVLPQGWLESPSWPDAKLRDHVPPTGCYRAIAAGGDSSPTLAAAHDKLQSQGHQVLCGKLDCVL